MQEFLIGDYEDPLLVPLEFLLYFIEAKTKVPNIMRLHYAVIGGRGGVKEIALYRHFLPTQLIHLFGEFSHMTILRILIGHDLFFTRCLRGITARYSLVFLILLYH